MKRRHPGRTRPTPPRGAGAPRPQVVSVEHGTPGGELGVPSWRELRDDPAAHAEKAGPNGEPSPDGDRPEP